MTKIDKEMDVPKASDLRRLEPPPNHHPGKGRGRNFEAADAALREKAARNPFWSRFLPENEASEKHERKLFREIVCECGHRGDKHGKYARVGWFRKPSAKHRLHAGCDVCGREADGCKQLRPKNATWMSVCSAHREFKDGCAACEHGYWMLEGS